ncbi:hypothetical protein HHK36_000843 [Tetracentron sinense]|uniref:Transmembrane protein n=1 Tax=Tetracentron sinense TaxID=13715 RepID=A0A834ZSW5_TETSI|nr:hypothetical protein HHK36_000843 [Tetracentron sinense]
MKVVGRVIQTIVTRTRESDKRKVRVPLSLLTFLFLSWVISSRAEQWGVQARRLSLSDVHFIAPGACTYPRSPALGLGLTASATLMVAQLVISFAAGCICCKRNPHPSKSKWTLALICFVVSWFTFVIGFLVLLSGAVLNDQHGDETMYFGNNCYVLKSGVFATGSVLSLATVILGILYYVTLSSAKNREDLWGGSMLPPSQGGIAMGQPQFAPPPQTSQPPLFVHEDTYNRRQIP